MGISIRLQDWLRERNAVEETDRQTDHRKPCGMGGGWNTRGPVARGKGRAAAGLARYPTAHSFAKESRHIGNPKIGVSWLRARTVAVGDTAIRNSETRALLKADFSLPADKVRLDLARGEKCRGIFSGMSGKGSFAYRS